MNVDRNVVVPASSTTTAGKSGAQTPAPDRSAWLKEMEKQELAAWLSHSPMLPRHHAVSLMAHTPVNPQITRDDAPVRTDAAAAGLGAADDKPASPPASAAGSGSGQHGSVDRKAGGTAATDGGRHRRGAGTEGDAILDIRASAEGAPLYQGVPMHHDGPVQDPARADGSSVGQPSQTHVPAAGIESGGAIIDAPSPSVEVLHPQKLAEAVMTVLNARAEGGTDGQTLHMPIPVAAVAAGPVVAEPWLSEAELSRPLNTLAGPSTMLREPRPGAGHAPAEQCEQSGDVQGQHAARKEQAGDLGQAPSLRIHAMRTASGVRIWIGADEVAGLGGRQLLLATEEIRRLLRVQGVPLASLTYNGESLFDAEDTPDASGGMQPLDPSTLRMRAKGGIGPRTRT